jgi:hypothetical protein
MPEKYWFKLAFAELDDERFLILEQLPEGDALCWVYFRLRGLAEKCDAGGVLLLPSGEPYDEMQLSLVLRRTVLLVQLAMGTYVRLGLAERQGPAIRIVPTTERLVMNKQRLLAADRQRRCRAKKYQNVTCHAAVTHQDLPHLDDNSNSSKVVTHENVTCHAVQQKTKEKYTTTSDILLLFRGTIFEQVKTTTIESLASRYGTECLQLAADIAAETWRRELQEKGKNKEIPNPGGYLQSLCSSLVIPSWYQSPQDRKVKVQAAEERKHASWKSQEDKKAAAEKDRQIQENYWSSLPETDREIFCTAAKASMNPNLEYPAVAIGAIAKSMAWNQRSQINTIDVCI